MYLTFSITFYFIWYIMYSNYVFNCFGHFRNLSEAIVLEHLISGIEATSNVDIRRLLSASVLSSIIQATQSPAVNYGKSRGTLVAGNNCIATNNCVHLNPLRRMKMRRDTGKIFF